MILPWFGYTVCKLGRYVFLQNKDANDSIYSVLKTFYTKRNQQQRRNGVLKCFVVPHGNAWRQILKIKNATQKTQNKNIGRIKCWPSQIFRWMAQYKSPRMGDSVQKIAKAIKIPPNIRFDTTRFWIVLCANLEHSLYFSTHSPPSALMYACIIMVSSASALHIKIWELWYDVCMLSTFGHLCWFGF